MIFFKIKHFPFHSENTKKMKILKNLNQKFDNSNAKKQNFKKRPKSLKHLIFKEIWPYFDSFAVLSL